MSNLTIENLTDEQIAAIVAEQRKRKMAKTKAEKYSHLEPHYSEYKKAVVKAKEANDEKKRLLVSLKSLGFGKRVTKVKTPTTKGKKK